MHRIWLVICFIIGPGLALAATQEETFTRRLLTKLEVVLPNHKLVYAGPLEIRDATTEGNIYLDRIYGFAMANPKEADAAIRSYVNRVAQVATEASKPISASALRLAVRNSVSLKRAMESLGAGPVAAYPREFVGDLVVVPVIDASSSVKYVGERDLGSLRRSLVEVNKLAEENLRKNQRPIEEVAKLSAQSGIGVISEEYAASRLIFISDWTQLEKNVGGNLVVMAPAFDTVIYGDGSSVIAVDALRTLGLRIGQTSQVPLSSNVFRLVKDHWELVP